MPTVPLPDEPSLEQLRNQAKDLRRAVLAGEPGALAEAAAAPGPLPLHAAQLTVARRYGFPSWARLKRYVEVIERYSRFPDRILAAGPLTATPAAGPDPADLADRFLRLASLCYADDQPERWAQARVLLAEHPELTAASVHAAAAAADTAALRRILAADPGRGPPRGRPVPVAAAVLPGLRPARPADR